MPGNPIPYSIDIAGTLTTSGNVNDAYILASTSFQNVANISHIEFVPISPGSLIIEVFRHDFYFNKLQQ